MDERGKGEGRGGGVMGREGKGRESKSKTLDIEFAYLYTCMYIHLSIHPSRSGRASQVTSKELITWFTSESITQASRSPKRVDHPSESITLHRRVDVDTTTRNDSTTHYLDFLY